VYIQGMKLSETTLGNLKKESANKVNQLVMSLLDCIVLLNCASVHTNNTMNEIYSVQSCEGDCFQSCNIPFKKCRFQSIG
ncbi:hypothetical protein S245_070072, partial [Arachis hypogaea]